ncbi:ATP-binding protein [Chlorobaculum thiosulfatiphilum]|uniref:ATP-binding protein n=1 Tax=Chlorobaculum thiosulfatiphilum TaxID=115852 RepID=A0A5C4S7I6_CHLTI|nr:ATP-binding protein [Chlorobaculum thiosulfatiphilum]TNJ38949.1 ATP-binding protein [Chlorobaculum thiosulfatiphilum]
MLPLSLASINEARLLELCESECQESQTLDFKRELPETIERDKSEPDKNKIELCKDVVAFANADGGHFVYGIQEKAGIANDIVPITTESADAAERRIRHVLDARIEPKIQVPRRISWVALMDNYKTIPERYNQMLIRKVYK